jgi:monofunctional biosynthetic peptidoglycan transglycosylase
VRAWAPSVWWWAWRAAVVVVAIPLVLTPLYRIVPPVSTLMVWSFVTGQGASRTWVSLDDMAWTLPAATVMSEDGRFCRHRGVDWDALGSVMDAADTRRRGASTIPMQTVKNLFLWTSRSYVRKALEIPLALYADAVLGKRRLMEIYLNIAEFGPGIFGVEAAAQAFFQRRAGALTARQSALLVATLPNPQDRNPARPSRLLQGLARTVEQRVKASGAYIDCLALKAPL